MVFVLCCLLVCFFFFFDCTRSSSSFVTLLYSSFPSSLSSPLTTCSVLSYLVPYFLPLTSFVCMCCCSLLFFLCILLSSFVSSCLFYSVSGIPSTSCFHRYTTTTATFFPLSFFTPLFFLLHCFSSVLCLFLYISATVLHLSH